MNIFLFRASTVLEELSRTRGAHQIDHSYKLFLSSVFWKLKVQVTFSLTCPWDKLHMLVFQYPERHIVENFVAGTM